MKIAAVLTQADRDNIRRKNFGMPKQRKYPIPDLVHARAALSMVKAHGSPEEQAQVVKAVAKKWPGLAERSTVVKSVMDKTAMHFMAKELEKIASGKGGFSLPELMGVVAATGLGASGLMLAAKKYQEYRKNKRTETKTASDHAPSGLLHTLGELRHQPLHSAAWEHATDVGGVGAMALASGSHLYGQLKQKYAPTEGGSEDGPISAAGQSSLDLGGLAAMSMPTAAALHQYIKHKGARPGAGGGSKVTNYLNAAGLGGLLIPTIDKAQAQYRTAKGEDPEKKMLLSHNVHRALELGGYGALMGGTLTNPDNTGADKAQILAGYGTLMAPHVVPFDGPARTGSELVGLGLLARPAIQSMMHH